MSATPYIVGGIAIVAVGVLLWASSDDDAPGDTVQKLPSGGTSDADKQRLMAEDIARIARESDAAKAVVDAEYSALLVTRGEALAAGDAAKVARIEARLRELGGDFPAASATTDSRSDPNGDASPRGSGNGSSGGGAALR